MTTDQFKIFLYGAIYVVLFNNRGSYGSESLVSTVTMLETSTNETQTDTSNMDTETYTQTDITWINKTIINTTETYTTRTDPTQADTTRIDTTRADSTQTDITRTDKTNMDTTETYTTRTDPTQADTTRIDTTRADSTQTDITRTGKTNMDTAETYTTRTDTTQTDTTKIDTTRADSTQTDITRTGKTNMDTAETYTTRTDTTQTDTTRIDPTRADTTQTDTTRIDPTRADSTQTDSTQADTTRTDKIGTGKTKTDTTKTDAITDKIKWYTKWWAYLIFVLVGAAVLAILLLLGVRFLCRDSNIGRKMTMVGSGERLQRWSHRLTHTFDAKRDDSDNSDIEDVQHKDINMSSFKMNTNGTNNGAAKNLAYSENEESGGGGDAGPVEQPPSAAFVEVDVSATKNSSTNDQTTLQEDLEKTNDVSTDAAESNDVKGTEEVSSGGKIVDAETDKTEDGTVANSSEVITPTLAKTDDVNTGTAESNDANGTDEKNK